MTWERQSDGGEQDLAGRPGERLKNPAEERHTEDDEGGWPGSAVSRRAFLGFAVGGLVATPALLHGQPVENAPVGRDGAKNGEAAPGTAATRMKFTLQINGEAYPLDIESRVTLLDALRERLDLPGTKKGCDHGQCGACTVLVDGRRVNSCLTLAVMCDGKQITTIEGLEAADGTLHPVQAAFADHDGLQCGYCTPGQIISGVAIYNGEPCGDSDEDVRECMSGNICRCGAYPNIVAAVQEARKAPGAKAARAAKTGV